MPYSPSLTTTTTTTIVGPIYPPSAGIELGDFLQNITPFWGIKKQTLIMAMGGMIRIEGNKMAEYGKVPYSPGEKNKK